MFLSLSSPLHCRKCSYWHRLIRFRDLKINEPYTRLRQYKNTCIYKYFDFWLRPYYDTFFGKKNDLNSQQIRPIPSHSLVVLYLVPGWISRPIHNQWMSYANKKSCIISFIFDDRLDVKTFKLTLLQMKLLQIFQKRVKSHLNFTLFAKSLENVIKCLN